MRRIPRARQFADLFLTPSQVSRLPYSICRACERRATVLGRARTATFTTSAIRNQGFDERMRSALWGNEEAERQRKVISEEYKHAEGLATDGPESEASQNVSVVAHGPAEDVEDDGSYKEASTWDGLEWVGGQYWVDQQYDSGDEFRGFANVAPFATEDIAKTAIAKAIRELDILKSLGLPLDTASKEEIAEALAEFAGAGAYPETAEVKSQLQKILSGQTLQGSEQAESMEIGSIPIVDIADPTFKFAIVKRVIQLTGVRIADPTISRCTTTEQLLSAFTEVKKPNKLAELLKQDDEVASLPNVTIVKRRITPIDKEKQVGRWKVIEKELMDRGLPVVGH